MRRHLATPPAARPGSPLRRPGAVTAWLGRLLWLALLAWLGCRPVLVTAAGGNDKLEAIRQRGEIVIGVKTDFAPFGQLDASGQPMGLEVDLARKVAANLGVAARIIGVTTSNRFERLEQGTVDLIIATTGDTLERRKLATAIEPHYFAAGVGVLLRPDQPARTWSDLRGKTLCAVEGAYFNRPVTRRYILELQMYRSVRDAKLALKNGRCVGFLYSDSAIHQDLGRPEWAGYRAPLPSALLVPWALFVSRSDQGSAYAQRLGDIVAKFHREGDLIALEKAWSLPSSAFLREQQALWRQRTDDGRFLCERDDKGALPLPCRNRAFVTASESAGIGGVGLWLKEQGLDVSFLYDPYDAGRYGKGILMTLLLVVLSTAGSLLIGYLAARAVLAAGGWARPVRAVANYVRMTPPLLQMYLLFFGVASALDARFSIITPPLVVAVLALSTYHGAIIMQALVEAVEHLRAGRPDLRLSADSLGEVLGHASIGIRTALSNLSKAVTIASAIAVPEVLSATMAIIGDQGNTEIMMNALLLVFLLLTTAWLSLLTRLEARLKSHLEAR